MATIVRPLRTESIIYERLRAGRATLLNVARDVLRRAVRGSVTVEQAIAAVETWLDPTKAPRVMAGAPLSVRAERVLGLLPGGAGYQARRIMVDTTNSAHGEARRQFAREHEMLVRWMLSPGHTRVDECDSKASRDMGFGSGVYPSGSAPLHPSHVMCRCVLTVVALSAERRVTLWRSIIP